MNETDTPGEAPRGHFRHPGAVIHHGYNHTCFPTCFLLSVAQVRLGLRQGMEGGRSGSFCLSPSQSWFWLCFHPRHHSCVSQRTRQLLPSCPRYTVLHCDSSLSITFFQPVHLCENSPWLQLSATFMKARILFPQNSGSKLIEAPVN